MEEIYLKIFFVLLTDIKQITDKTREEEKDEPVITSRILGQTLISSVKPLGLFSTDCTGMGCDGSINMSTVWGAAFEIQNEAKNATVCLCYNHAHNFWISKASAVRSVNSAMGIIHEVVSVHHREGILCSTHI
jgi:hypothetical protein